MTADLCTSDIIDVRGLGGISRLPATRLGDWAAHRTVDRPDLYCLTLLPIGLSLPLVWCSFTSQEAAVGAMRDVARLRNDWSVITQADLTLALRAALEAIARRHGAVEGPIQMQADADRNFAGRTVRINGYQGVSHG